MKYFINIEITLITNILYESNNILYLFIQGSKLIKIF